MAAKAQVAVVVVPVAVALAPPAGAEAAARLAMWNNLRRRWAQALVVLGCAAAALAIFSINSLSPSTAHSRRLLGPAACARTDAEAAALRARSVDLLVLAALQVLGATAALLVPSRRLFSDFSLLVGLYTPDFAGGVLLGLFECHGRVHDVVVSFYFTLVVLVFVGYLIGRVVVDNSG